MKQEVEERFQSVASRYQPLVDPIIEALNGQMDAFNQLPAVAYATKVAERFSQQLNEFAKYVELEAQLRSILRQTLRKTDQLVKQLAEDLKGSLNIPGKPTATVAKIGHRQTQFTPRNGLQPILFQRNERRGQIPTATSPHDRSAIR